MVKCFYFFLALKKFSFFSTFLVIYLEVLVEHLRWDVDTGKPTAVTRVRVVPTDGVFLSADLKRKNHKWAWIILLELNKELETIIILKLLHRSSVEAEVLGLIYFKKTEMPWAQQDFQKVRQLEILPNELIKKLKHFKWL